MPHNLRIVIALGNMGAILIQNEAHAILQHVTQHHGMQDRAQMLNTRTVKIPCIN